MDVRKIEKIEVIIAEKFEEFCDDIDSKLRDGVSDLTDIDFNQDKGDIEYDIDQVIRSLNEIIQDLL